MQKKTEQLSLPQRALCNWMLFLHTLTEAWCSSLWFSHRFLFTFGITLFNALFAVCYNINDSSSAGGQWMLPVSSRYLGVTCASHCMEWGSAHGFTIPVLSPHSPETREPHFFSPHPHKPSSKPVPTHQANMRAVAISNTHSAQPSAEAATNQTFPQLVPWLNSSLYNSDPANNIYHLTSLRLKGHVIFHKNNTVSKT